MKKNLKRYIFHSIAIVILTGFICITVRTLSFNTLFLDPIGQTLKNFRFTDTYFYIENASESISDINTDIVLFDISGCNSRTEIAAAIQVLHDCQPKVIALDIIFGRSSESDRTANDSLINVIKRCPEIITACRVVPVLSGFKIESSYFTNSVSCIQACVNIENETVRNFSSTVNFGEIRLPTFSSEIIRVAYPECYSELEKRKNQEELINYKRLIFDVLHIGRPFQTEDVRNKVILVGDLQDLQDYHSVPVAIDGQRRVSGTIIHAYAVSTVTKDRMINKMPVGYSLLLGVFLSFMFCIICCWVFDRYEKLSGLMTNVYQLILLLFLAFAGGIIFIKFRYNIDLLYAMLGIGLAGFSTELWYFIISTTFYKKIKNRIFSLFEKNKNRQN